MLHIWALVGDDAYTFTFSARQLDYQEYLLTIEKMIESFRFANVPAEITQVEDQPPVSNKTTPSSIEEETLPQLTQKFETYESKEFGFTLEHPSDWQVEEPSIYEIELIGHRPYSIRMELPSSLEDDIATRTNRPMVEIGMDTSDSNSLEQYVSEQIDSTISFTPDVNINTNETTLAGLPAIAVVMTPPGGGRKGMDIYTMTNEGTIYNIHYSAHESKFDTYLPIVQKMIDSFKINTITSESQNNTTRGQELETVIPGLSLNNSAVTVDEGMTSPSTGEPSMEEVPGATPCSFAICPC